jgi:hypothetical protein
MLLQCIGVCDLGNDIYKSASLDEPSGLEIQKRTKIFIT